MPIQNELSIYSVYNFDVKLEILLAYLIDFFGKDLKSRLPFTVDEGIP